MVASGISIFGFSVKVNSNKAWVVVIFLLLHSNVFCQDTLYFENGNVVEGSIKDMQHNLLSISADYGDEDFIIEWDEIKEISTNTYFKMYLIDGTIHYGRLRSGSNSRVYIISKNSMIDSCNHSDILSMQEIGLDFNHRFSGGFDIGLGMTKANNLRRYSASANVGYQADNWAGHVDVNALYSSQDDTEPIKRFEGHADYRYMFYKDWTLYPSVNFLTSTEQKIALRTNLKLGVGEYIMRKKHGYWSIGAGLNWNIENYTNETPDRTGLEVYVGTEIRLFDLKDLELLTKAAALRSISEGGRWRCDLLFNLKYDLPHDLYINTKFSLNYDNQPAEGANEIDYVLQLGIGWSW